MGLIFALALLPGVITSAVADDVAKTTARDGVEGYVAAALAGKVDTAIALAVKGQSPGKKERIEDFKAMLGVKALKIDRVLVGEKKGQAIAISEAVKLTKANPDGQDSGLLLFALVRSGDKWLVKDIDFRTDDQAKERVKGFETKNPDSKEIPDISKK